MDEERLWNLFFSTGLPQVYLAIQAAHRAEEQVDGGAEEISAFRRETDSIKKV